MTNTRALPDMDAEIYTIVEVAHLFRREIRTARVMVRRDGFPKSMPFDKDRWSRAQCQATAAGAFDAGDVVTAADPKVLTHRVGPTPFRMPR